MNKIYSWLICCTVSICLHGSPSIAADDYTDMLEQEAESLKLDQKGQINHKQKTQPIRNAISRDSNENTQTVLPAGLTRDGFETLLATQFHNTYLFFTRLRNKDKDAVYITYNSNNMRSLYILSKEIKLRMRH